jgi:5'-nucleotidase
VRILVTNDDGVTAPGLHELAEALSEVGDVTVVAPATNQTAVARAISLHAPVVVDEAELPGGRTAYAVEGTPTDCVRFALLGLATDPPEIVVAGVNEGANMGDDIGYSGTVAAAFEGIISGIPAIAVSQRELGADALRGGRRRFDFTDACAFTAGLVGLVGRRGLASGTLLNVNAPGVPQGAVRGVRVTRLGRRIYRTMHEQVETASGRRRYRLYDDEPGYHHEDGTDFAAIASGCISVTPIHFDVTAHAELEALGTWPLAGLVPA